MSHPQFKVTVTHGGSDYTYESRVCNPIRIKHRESNYSTAELTVENQYSQKYLGEIQKFDVIQIWFKVNPWESFTVTPQFGGIIRQVNPACGGSDALLGVICKGYGSALEDTNCNREYGLESKNSSLHHIKLVAEDLVDNMINKSLGSADNTGYAITKTKIADIASATAIKYINNPYRANIDVVDVLCDLSCAIGTGATAGAHWIVDNAKNLIINTIGAHENTAEWPDWWNTDQSGSTLTQGIDFLDYAVLDKAEEFANKVVLVTDFRRPSFDYWTEDSGGSALWGNDGLTSVTDSNTQFVVGSHSLKLTPNGANAGYAYYPSTENSAWDITKWGSERVVPRLNFYYWKGNGVTETTTYVILFKTDHKTDYFYTKFSDTEYLGYDTHNKWLNVSIPIGPYWKTSDVTKPLMWIESGVTSADWANINGICFFTSLAGANGEIYIDDLHFSGKLIRSAKDSTNITANKEVQKVLIARNSMDDSCIASDDSGFAARIAYSELLRRTADPKTIVFKVPLKPQMMAGQKLHVHAEKKMDGNYRIDLTTRIIEVIHEVQENMATSTITATSDLKNTRPINIPDQYAMMQENMFLNSNEAKNIRAGGEVDLLIPILEKDYPS
jgi:hypothetical protein